MQKKKEENRNEVAFKIFAADTSGNLQPGVYGEEGTDGGTGCAGGIHEETGGGQSPYDRGSVYRAGDRHGGGASSGISADDSGH